MVSLKKSHGAGGSERVQRMKSDMHMREGPPQGVASPCAGSLFSCAIFRVCRIDERTDGVHAGFARTGLRLNGWPQRRATSFTLLERVMADSATDDFPGLTGHYFYDHFVLPRIRVDDLALFTAVIQKQRTSGPDPSPWLQEATANVLRSLIALHTAAQMGGTPGAAKLYAHGARGLAESARQVRLQVADGDGDVLRHVPPPPPPPGPQHISGGEVR